MSSPIHSSIIVWTLTPHSSNSLLFHVIVYIQKIMNNLWKYSFTNVNVYPLYKILSHSLHIPRLPHQNISHWLFSNRTNSEYSDGWLSISVRTYLNNLYNCWVRIKIRTTAKCKFFHLALPFSHLAFVLWPLSGFFLTNYTSNLILIKKRSHIHSHSHDKEVFGLL